jgi:hypothetical protein
MQRISTDTRSKNKFGAGKDGFSNGDAVAGTPATELDADWFDAVQEELLGVIESAGLQPASALTQLLAALRIVGRQRQGALGTDTGTANALEAEYEPAVTALVDNERFFVTVAEKNTGATTFTPAPGVIDALPVYGLGFSALTGGELVAGGLAELVYRESLGGYVLIYCAGSGIASAVSSTRSISAGSGLAGGGDLSANRTISMLTPQSLTSSTSNAASSSGHTHKLDISGFYSSKSHSEIGYQKLPSGLILQWGIVDDDAETKVFPIAWPNACFVIIGSAKSDSFNSSTSITAYVVSLSEFRIRNGGTANDSSIPNYYIAIGY